MIFEDNGGQQLVGVMAGVQLQRDYWSLLAMSWWCHAMHIALLGQ
jgi:hypothetical protein